MALRRPRGRRRRAIGPCATRTFRVRVQERPWHELQIGFDDRARVERRVPASVQRRERRATARRMKPTKKASVASAFLAFADIIADPVAMKLGEASKQAEPQMAPKWLPGPGKPPRRRRAMAPEGEDMRDRVDRVLRASGFVTYGDPGYDEALKRHLERTREHDAGVRRRAQMRTAVRMFERLIGAATRRGSSRPAKRRSSSR